MIKISEKIINQLRFGKTSNGAVGCRVKATGVNPNNKAWLKIFANKMVDARFEPIRYIFKHYQVEYLELREEYDPEVHGYNDVDLYVKKEIYYNIPNEEALEALLGTWIEDFSVLTPYANIGHP